MVGIGEANAEFLQPGKDFFSGLGALQQLQEHTVHQKGPINQKLLLQQGFVFEDGGNNGFQRFIFHISVVAPLFGGTDNVCQLPDGGIIFTADGVRQRKSGQQQKRQPGSQNPEPAVQPFPQISIGITGKGCPSGVFARITLIAVVFQKPGIYSGKFFRVSAAVAHHQLSLSGEKIVLHITVVQQLFNIFKHLSFIHENKEIAVTSAVAVDHGEHNERMLGSARLLHRAPGKKEVTAGS